MLRILDIVDTPQGRGTIGNIHGEDILIIPEKGKPFLAKESCVTLITSFIGELLSLKHDEAFQKIFTAPDGYKQREEVKKQKKPGEKKAAQPILGLTF